MSAAEKPESEAIDLLPSQQRTLTTKQKQMIRDRDNNACQFPEPHNCNDHERTPHVHHVTPFGVATRLMGKSAAATDHPNNLLTVCEEIHIGGRRNARRRILHPDVPDARREYAQGDKDAFAKMQQKREEMMSRGETYHRSDKDTEMKMRAHVNTRRAQHEGRFNMTDFLRAGKRTRRTITG